MINHKDLRIGNYLRIKKSDTIIQVEPYMLSITELINYAPIFLSPELLERLGFVVTRTTAHPNNIWTLKYEEGVFELEEIKSFFLCSSQYNVEIKYLHQLQNLYFALTNEELTLK